MDVTQRGAGGCWGGVVHRLQRSIGASRRARVPSAALSGLSPGDEMKRPRVLRRSACGALALTLALGVAGCSDEDAPSGSPVPSDSSSATPSASVPALPDAARGRSPEAAEAFVRHYVDLINYGLRTLDSEPLRETSAPGCEACDYFIEAIDTTRERSGRYEGGGWSATGLEQLPHGPEDEFNVRALVEIEAGRVVQSSPRDIARFDEERTVYNFIVSQSQSEFRMKAISGIAQ